jgi:DNA-binding NarL/FixJ family response regulator
VALSSRDVRRMLDILRRDRGTLRPRIELTARQRSVLELIVRGESVKQTARTLGIAVKTVENTQSRLYRRLGVRNRSQAVAVAMQSGLVASSDDDQI